MFALVTAICRQHIAILSFESFSANNKRKADAFLLFLGMMVIMDTIYGGNLANAPLPQNLHPKALGCTLVHIFAPCTDKVHPKEYWKSLGYQLDKLEFDAPSN